MVCVDRGQTEDGVGLVWAWSGLNGFRNCFVGSGLSLWVIKGSFGFVTLKYHKDQSCNYCQYEGPVVA